MRPFGSLGPFTHDVLKETVRSLPQHRVSIVSRSNFDVERAVGFTRAAERSKSRHKVQHIFRTRYAELIEEKQSEWPTEATLQHTTPEPAQQAEQLAPTILDSEVEIDQHLLDSMVHELAREEAAVEPTVAANVVDLSAIRAAVNGSAISADEAKERMITASVPQGEEHDFPKAA